MFQLSEQTKSGVPIAFRDAYDADTANDNDTELQHVESDGTSRRIRTTKPSKGGGLSVANTAAVVMIDLVD
jgi:hypothetical protein